MLDSWVCLVIKSAKICPFAGFRRTFIFYLFNTACKIFTARGTPYFGKTKLAGVLNSKGPFKSHQGREEGTSTKTVTSIVSDCKFYCFHVDRGGREVWKWSFLRWRHFWMAPYLYSVKLRVRVFFFVIINLTLYLIDLKK